MALEFRKWIAQPKQLKFLLLKVKEALYGGAAGGGKSDALIIFAILYALKYPRSKILFLRRTLQELQKEGAAIPRMLELLSGTKWKWREQKKKWYAPNGSVIEFGYCESEADVHQYQSAQYEVIIFDELTHFTEFQYRYMFSRCRSAKGYPSCVRAATNPGNVGHSWVKKRFVTICPPGEIFTWEEKNIVTGNMEKMQRCFIPARVWDNKVLCDNDPGYILFLQGLPENDRRALLEGDWDVFKGQYFTEWRYDKHVIKPFEIPKDWNRYMSMDWGMARPSVIYWYAISHEGRVYVYRELYIKGKMALDVAKECLKRCLEGDKDVRYAFFSADPSIWAKKGEAPESIGSQFQTVMKYPDGTPFPMRKAKNERVSGWSKVREWLSDAPDGKPWMQVFETCTELIRTMPEQIYDETNVEDLNTDGEDDCADSLRYFCVMRPRRSEMKEADPVVAALPPKDKERVLRERAWAEKQKSNVVANFLRDVTI